MNDPTVLTAIDTISGFILGYAVTLAALAALTVGIQEAFKKVFGILARFHRHALLCWLMQPPSKGRVFRTQLAATLAKGGHYTLPAGAGRPAAYDPYKAYAQLLHLTVGIELEDAHVRQSVDAPMRRNVTRALFELDLARMMTQVQEAADAALGAPHRHAQWFDFITSGCDAGDVKNWRDAMNPDRKEPVDREALADVHSRMRLLVRRRLDSFQTVTAYRWAEWNQFCGWALGVVLLFAAQVVAGLQKSDRVDPKDLPMMILISLAGGILAPVAKDLVDALAKVKRGG